MNMCIGGCEKTLTQLHNGCYVHKCSVTSALVKVIVPLKVKYKRKSIQRITLQQGRLLGNDELHSFGEDALIKAVGLKYYIKVVHPNVMKH